MNKLNLNSEQIDYILSPKAIRDGAERIYKYAKDGHSYFEINSAKLQPTINYVLDVIKKKYPDLNIPFHSRWGHFRAGNIDRAAILDSKITHVDKLEKARIKLDLVITSVLLDAGAGSSWSYFEKSADKNFNRSEGLGVASFYLFLDGQLSSDRKTLQADAAGLKALSADNIRKYFQVSEKNPLLGVEGRVHLLNNLGEAVENKKIFSHGRPGNILDYLIEKFGTVVPATAILRAVLDGFGPIWPSRLKANGINLGDVWYHSNVASDELDSLIPLHKLSQWMTYSLIEPLIEAGIEVTGVEQLTGLAEYRNGGLLIDSGLLELKNPLDAQKEWPTDSDLIIEWRALTIYFLDIIGAEVQKALGKTAAEFPLAKVLEGGTWWAGRNLAKEKRSSGDPPVLIKSDGTVF